MVAVTPSVFVSIYLFLLVYFMPSLGTVVVIVVAFSMLNSACC